MIFKVFNPDGSEPDLRKIVVSEEWAEDLHRDYVDGFAITPFGELIVIDELGNYRYPPKGRFEVYYMDDVV